MAMVRERARLRHLHLADGVGRRGRARAGASTAAAGQGGRVRRPRWRQLRVPPPRIYAAGGEAQRELDLAEALAFARLHLATSA